MYRSCSSHPESHTVPSPTCTGTGLSILNHKQYHHQHVQELPLPSCITDSTITNMYRTWPCHPESQTVPSPTCTGVGLAILNHRQYHHQHVQVWDFPSCITNSTITNMYRNWPCHPASQTVPSPTCTGVGLAILNHKQYQHQHVQELALSCITNNNITNSYMAND